MATIFEDFITAAPAISAGVGALTFVVAIGTLIKAIIEYQRQNAVKRFEKFQEINKRLDEPNMASLKPLLETDAPELMTVPYIQKHDFLGIHEEIAIMVNTKIMKKKVAYYMYGYYAIRCYRSKYFWEGEETPGRDSIYWSLFNEFAREMLDIETKSVRRPINPKKLRF
jgi:hypothetical protein